MGTDCHFAYWACCKVIHTNPSLICWMANKMGTNANTRCDGLRVIFRDLQWIVRCKLSFKVLNLFFLFNAGLKNYEYKYISHAKVQFGKKKLQALSSSSLENEDYQAIKNLILDFELNTTSTLPPLMPANSLLVYSIWKACPPAHS
jgi:hypothetical protein